MMDDTLWACALDRKQPIAEQLRAMTSLYAERHGAPPREAHVNGITAEWITEEAGVTLVVNNSVPMNLVYFPLSKTAP
jgi:hypothetical protein